MGCDIHTHAEKRNPAGEWEKVPGLEPFRARNYRVFGFLAGVRNYSDLEPVSAPRGMPKDASAEVAADYESWGEDSHSASWMSVAELFAIDYDATREDRRVTRQVGPNYWNGGCTCEPGEGAIMPLREILGGEFFRDLGKLVESGAERVVFWFDN